MVWSVLPNGWVLACELSACEFGYRCNHLNFRYCDIFEYGVPWHSGKYRVSIHSKNVRDMTRTYSQKHGTDKYSHFSSIIWLVCPNSWVFFNKLSGCGFRSRSSLLNFWYWDYFEYRIPWHSGKYRVWIHSETRTWHSNNIHSNPPER